MLQESVVEDQKNDEPESDALGVVLPAGQLPGSLHICGCKKLARRSRALIQRALAHLRQNMLVYEVAKP